MLSQLLRQWWLGLSLLLVGGFIFLGASGGAGNQFDTDYTGSPTSTVSCAACHSGGSFNPSASVRLLQNGTEVSSYMPNTTYQVEFDPSFDSGAQQFGFQFTAADGESGNSIGTFGAPASGTRTLNIGANSYWEHATRLQNDVITIDWTSPDAEEFDGTASFYYALLAINGNGSTSGDHPINGQLDIPAMSSSSTDIRSCLQEARIFPNPGHLNEMNIDWGEHCSPPSDVHAFVVDPLGRRSEWTDPSRPYQGSQVQSGVHYVELRTAGDINVIPILVAE